MLESTANNFSKAGCQAVQRRYGRGVTLPEMLVAVSITVMMLMIIGVVFKSSTDASGKAIANNDIMNQLRCFTGQLQQDFEGFQNDMPFAIIFEEDQDDPRRPRRDRIVFFTSGNFQTTDYYSTESVNGSVAQIFYGQSSDDDLPPPNTDLEAGDPCRAILTRRCKILTQDATQADSPLRWFRQYKAHTAGYSSDEAVDCMPCMPVGLSTSASWKNIPFFDNSVDIDYYRILFNDNPGQDIRWSMIRRPNLRDVKYLGSSQAMISASSKGFQRLYMLPDVTDFRIELWFAGANEWFPNAKTLDDIDFDSNYTLFSESLFAFAWNTPADPDDNTTGLSDTIIDDGDYNVDWRLEGGLERLKNSGLVPWDNHWPEALRFTFTLYDRNRRHYPNGRTFSYIVKLPKR